MPTIKDVAKMAGVSHGTVSNVLNRRGNVSLEKIRVVEEAARAMGYQLNDTASSLRSGSSHTIHVIVPNLHSAAYDDFVLGVKDVAAARGVAVSINASGGIPVSEKTNIDDALSARAMGIIVITCMERPKALYQRVLAGGARLVMAERGASEGVPFVGFDMESAARDMTRRVLSGNPKHIGLITGFTGYPNERAFRDTVLSCVAQCAQPPEITRMEAISAHMINKAFELFDAGNLPDAILCTCEESARAVKTAYGIYAPDHLPLICSLAPARTLSEDGFLRYELHYRHLGRHACRRILDDAPADSANFSLAAKGFCEWPTLKRYTHGISINLLSQESPHIQAFSKIVKRFTRETGIDVRIATLPYPEIHNVIQEYGNSGVYDIIRMDMMLMDMLCRRTFTPLDELPLDGDEMLGRVIPSLHKAYTAVDGVLYTLPFDPSIEMLYYRRDLFEDPAVRRDYYEKYKMELLPPETASDFIRIAEFFTRAFNPKSQTEYGCSLTKIGPEFLSFLVSRLPQGKVRDLDDELCVKAFLDYLRLCEYSCPRNDGWWSDLVRDFVDGRCAMIVTFSNYVQTIATNPMSRVAGRVGYAGVPGKLPLLGGGVLGVPRACAHKAEASALLTWLYDENVGALLALLSGCTMLKSAVANPDIFDLYPWLGMAEDGFRHGIRRDIFQNIPKPFNQFKAESHLGVACKNALTGVLAPEDALRRAAELLKRNGI